jgi:hypothetical protein
MPVPPQGANFDFDRIANLVPTIEKLSGVLDKLEKSMGGFSTATLDQSLDAFSRDVKSAIHNVDSITEKTERMARAQKDFLIKHSTVKDLNDALKVIKEISDANDDMAEHGMGSKEFVERVKEFKTIAKDVTRDLQSGLISNEQAMGKLLDASKKTNSALGGMKSNHFKGITKEIAHADRALSSLLGKAPMLAKFGEMKEKSARLRVLHEEHKRNKEKSKKEHGYTADKRELGSQKNKFVATPEWWKLSKKDQEKAVRSHYTGVHEARLASGNRGVIDRWSARSLRNSEINGTQGNPFARLGQSLVSSGEGSAAKGLVSKGSGIISEGATGAMELASKVAIPFAILGVFKDLFDSRANKNSALETQLGSGGIYSAGSPADSMGNLRRNLRGDFYNQYGLGYEKNLGIAKSMVDNGVDISDLASDKRKTNGDGITQGTGMFGQLQENVAKYGRAAGLDQNATTAQTMKLVMQYRQSLVSTEDFFVKIDKDATAAGISTSKYIDILDGINDQYTKSARNIETTIDVMKLLGRTGKMTAEDMKEMVTGISTGADSRNLATRTFLGMKMYSSGQGSQSKKEAQMEVDQALKAVNDSGGYGLTSKDVQGPGGMGKILNLLGEVGTNPNLKGDGQQQAAREALNGLKDKLTLKQLKDAAADNPNTSNIMNLNSYMTRKGTGQFDNIQQNMAALDFSAKASGSSFHDLVMNPTLGNNGELLSQIMNATGTNQSQMDGAVALNVAKVGEVGSLIQKYSGLSKEDYAKQSKPEQQNAKAAFDNSYLALIEAGKIKNNPGQDHESAVKDYISEVGLDQFKNDIYGRSAIYSSIGGKEESEYENSINPDAKDKAGAKAEGIQGVTQTSGYLMSQGFEWLFEKLLIPLDIISAAFTKKADPQQLSDVDKASKSGYLDKAFKAKQDEIDAQAKKVEDISDPKERGQAQMIVDASQDHLDKLRREASDPTHAIPDDLNEIISMAFLGKTNAQGGNDPRSHRGNNSLTHVRRNKIGASGVNWGDISPIDWSQQDTLATGTPTKSTTNVSNTFNNVTATQTPITTRAANKSKEAVKDHHLTMGWMK